MVYIVFACLADVCSITRSMIPVQSEPGSEA